MVAQLSVKAQSTPPNTAHADKRADESQQQRVRATATCSNSKENQQKAVLCSQCCCCNGLLVIHLGRYASASMPSS